MGEDFDGDLIKLIISIPNLCSQLLRLSLIYPSMSILRQNFQCDECALFGEDHARITSTCQLYSSPCTMPLQARIHLFAKGVVVISAVVDMTTQEVCSLFKLDKWCQHAKRTSNDTPPELPPLGSPPEFPPLDPPPEFPRLRPAPEFPPLGSAPELPPFDPPPWV